MTTQAHTPKCGSMEELLQIITADAVRGQEMLASGDKQNLCDVQGLVDDLEYWVRELRKAMELENY